MDPQSTSEEIENSLYIMDYSKGIRIWTPFGITTILNYYLAKKSIKEIANLCDTTKNSIVGVLNRARKRGELPPVEKSPTKGIPKVRKVKPQLDPQSLRVLAMVKEIRQAKTLEHKVRLRVIKDITQVTLVQLKPHMCKWPIGDPKLSDFRFCGKNRMVAQPYCPDHVAISTRPSRGRGDY